MPSAGALPLLVASTSVLLLVLVAGVVVLEWWGVSCYTHFDG